ncbi:MAG: helix-turn-helix domain-containing protein [Polyangiaceae bacterium]
MIHNGDATTRASDRRELRTEAILDRAMEILESDDLDGLTLQRVAQTLGLVTTAIYRYFPSKDALIAALQRRAVREISAHFESELETLTATLGKVAPATASLATLLTLADLYLSLPDTHPHEWRLVARLLGDPRQLLSDEEATKTAPLLGAFLERMESVFALAQETEALSPGDANARVYAFWSALHGAHCMDKARRVARRAPSVADIGRFASGALLTSWGATPARLSAAHQLTRTARPGETEPAASKPGIKKKKGRV